MPLYKQLAQVTSCPTQSKAPNYIERLKLIIVPNLMSGNNQRTTLNVNLGVEAEQRKATFESKTQMCSTRLRVMNC